MGKERFLAQSRKVMYALFNEENAKFMIDLASESNAIFSGFITGKIIDSLFIGMWILKMPYVVLVSVIVGVTNVIPYFGPFIGAIPSIIIILTESPLQALIFAIFVLLLQQFDGNILGPMILGDTTGISAFWVIFSVTLFGGLFGFLGMFLGVPVIPGLRGNVHRCAGVCGGLFGHQEIHCHQAAEEGSPQRNSCLRGRPKQAVTAQTL